MGPAQSDPFTRKWQNTIAICSLMKDEHIDDVKEWISYHRCALSRLHLRMSRCNRGECCTPEQVSDVKQWAASAPHLTTCLEVDVLAVIALH